MDSMGTEGSRPAFQTNQGSDKENCPGNSGKDVDGKFDRRKVSVEEEIKSEIDSISVDDGYITATPSPSPSSTRSSSPVSIPASPVKRSLSLNAEDLPVSLKNLSLGECLGRGTYGSVYRLKNIDELQASPKLAIKICTKPSGLKNLYHESRIVESVENSELIVSNYGVHQVDGRDGLVMQLVEGTSLESVFQKLRSDYRDNRLTHSQYWGVCQFLIKQAVSALVHLERYGVVHADIKPDNYILEKGTWQVKLIDFGLSEEKGSPVTPGNPIFTPPEAMNFVYTGTVPATEKLHSYSIGQMTYTQGESKWTDPEYFSAGVNVDALQHNDVALSMALALATDQLLTTAKAGGRWQAIREVDGSNSVSSKTYQVTNEILKASYRQDSLAAVARFTCNFTVASPGYCANKFETAYVNFTNHLLHPDATKRMSMSEAMNHNFLTMPLLEEEEAQAVLTRTFNGL